VPGVYGDWVVGHDHLMAGPGSGGDFNVGWVPTLILFTNSAAANTHVTTLAQGKRAGSKRRCDRGPARWHQWNAEPDFPLLVSGAVYANGTPYHLSKFPTLERRCGRRGRVVSRR
jgi:hypothetical protein